LGGLLWNSVRELIEQATATAKATLDGISRDVPADNVEALLAVKNCLTGVAAKEGEVMLMLDVARGALAELRRTGARKDKDVAALQSRLERGRALWDDAVKRAPICKANIAPLVKLQAAQTRKDIEAFEAATDAFAKKADENAYWQYEAGACRARAPASAARCLSAHSNRPALRFPFTLPPRAQATRPPCAR
jgi:hypothetical protein